MEKKRKTLGKLKLNHLCNDELKDREMNALKGGTGACTCTCGGSRSLVAHSIEDHSNSAS